MFDDPHLNAGDGLLDMEIEDGTRTKLPNLPIALDGARLPLRNDPPKAGEHTEAVFKAAGLDVGTLKASGAI